MSSTLRETLEASDNPFLRSVPAEAFGSYSTILGQVTGQTKTSRFDFDADFSYRKYWGPGAVGSLAETNENGVRLHYETFGKVDKAYIDAIWRRRSAALAILDDFGVPSNVGGDIHTSTLLGGIERSLTATDVWTWSTRASSTDYQPASGGTQYFDVATTSTFRHQSNRTSALTALSELEWLKYDNATHTSIFILRNMAGLEIQPTKLLSFVTSAGAATVITEQGEAPPVVNPLLPAPGSGVSTGFIGSALLTYKILPTTELTLVASQTVGPTQIGVLTTRQAAGASVRHAINHLSSVTGRADFSRQIIPDGETDFWTASVTYSRILARDWTLDLTYQFKHRSATSGTTSVIFDPVTGVPIFLNGTSADSASSNSVLVALSKRFVLLPKRTPN